MQKKIFRKSTIESCRQAVESSSIWGQKNSVFSNRLKRYENYFKLKKSSRKNLIDHYSYWKPSQACEIDCQTTKLVVPILNALWIAEQTLIVKEAVHVTSLLAWRFVHVTLSFGLNLIISCFSNLNKRIKNQTSESATTAVHVQKLHCIVKHVS